VGTGGTSLRPIPGPHSLAEEVYNAENPAGVGGNLVPGIQQSPGSSQETSRSQAQGFYSADGWRYRDEDCRVHTIRVEVPHATVSLPPNKISS